MHYSKGNCYGKNIIYYSIWQNYNTQIIGKWHLGVGFKKEYLPGEGAYGFDNFYGSPYSHDMCPCNVCFPTNSSCFIQCWDRANEVSCPLFRLYICSYSYITTYTPDQLIAIVIKLKCYMNITCFRNKKIIEQPVYLPDLSERFLSESLKFISDSQKENRPFFLYVPFHHVCTFSTFAIFKCCIFLLLLKITYLY